MAFIAEAVCSMFDRLCRVDGLCLAARAPIGNTG
jgi:hypothetical protein